MLNTVTIKEYAYALGFDIVRVTGAEEFPETERVIKERIAQGLMDAFHGLLPNAPMFPVILMHCCRAPNPSSPLPCAISPSNPTRIQAILHAGASPAMPGATTITTSSSPNCNSSPPGYVNTLMTKLAM